MVVDIDEQIQNILLSPPRENRMYPHSTLCRSQGRCCRELPDGWMDLVTIQGNIYRMVVIDGTCQALDDKDRCTVYDDRPLMCACWKCKYCNG